jgi:hypothetical protein
MYLKLLAIASVAATEGAPANCPQGFCADTQRESSVLMQRLNRRGRQLPLKVAKQATPTQQSRSAELYQVTAQMLREGTTNDAFEFANDTLAELEAVVLPALMHGFEDDKKLLVDLMTHFTNASSTFAVHKTEIEQLQSKEDAASHDHKQCRDVEVHQCDTTITCETERTRLWTIYKESETEYQSIVTLIKHQWCEVNENRSEATWRESTERKFEHFITMGEERITKLEAHDEWSTKCEQGNHTLTEALENCDRLKKDLEAISCARESAYDTALDHLDISWQVGSDAYTEIVAAVRERENFRHSEFKSLKGIKCLLKHIIERALKECADDEEHNEILEECESYWQIDVELALNPWNLTYPEIPEKPEAPPQGVEPCSEEYHAMHYGEWDGMPCFDSMPECIPCAEIPLPAQDAVESTVPTILMQMYNEDSSEISVDGEFGVPLHTGSEGTV